MQVQCPRAVIFKGRQRRVFAKNLVRMLPGKGVAVPQPFCNLRDDPPVRFCLSRGRQKGALARNTPLGIGHSAVLLPPGQRRKTDMGEPAGVGIVHDLRNNHQRAACQRLTYGVTVRQRDRWVGAHDPHRLHLATGNGIEQFNRHQAWRLRQPFRSPETRHPRKIVRLKVHVRRQLIRQPAHFPSAHGVWLSGQRKRTAARAVEFSAGKMDVDDSVTLVATAR